MFGSIGFPEVVLIFVVVLMLFGPKKLPEFAKFFGKAMREFRKTVNEAKATIEDEIEKADMTKDINEFKQDLKEITSIDDIKEKTDIAKDLKEIDKDIKEVTRIG